MYALTDAKLSKYSPNEAQKVWERMINRKVTHQFNPSQALELLQLGSPQLSPLDEVGRTKLIQDYLSVSHSKVFPYVFNCCSASLRECKYYHCLQFKVLMMLVDPNDDEDDTDNKKSSTSPPPNPEDVHDPENPGYADPNLEISTYGAEEADALATSMQPTVTPPAYITAVCKSTLVFR